MAIPLIGSSGTATGGTNIAALLQALLPTLIGTGTTTGTQTQTQGTAINPQINDLLTQLFSGVTAGNSGYTKDAAIADSTNVINGMVKQAIDANMPSVLGGGRQAGVYNDTTTTLLNNDLQSRIAAQAANLVQQNINNYAQITGNNNNTAANIGAQLAQGNRTQTNTNTTTQQTSPAIGGSAKNNIMTGLLGTVGGTALKNMPWDKLYNGVSSALGSIGSAGSSAIDAGGFLNAGYGFDNGLGGAAPSFGAGLDLGNLGSAAGFSGSTYDFGSALSNLGSSAGDVASNVGSAISGFADSAGQGAVDLAGSIGGGLGSAWDWLGDTAGNIGDWFSGFFANGGLVPSRDDFRTMADGERAKMANGGKVPEMANGGRAGNAAYTDGSTRRPVYDISQALWESLTGNAPQTGGTAVEAPGTNDQGGISQISGAELAAYVQSQINRLADMNEQAQPSTGQMVAQSGLSNAQRTRSIANMIDKATAAGGAGDLAAASGLQGASSALEGGISTGGANAVGGSDILGALSGNSGTLPTYAEASGGQGSPLLGAGTTAAGGELAAAGIGGAGAALSGAGAGSLAGTVGATDALGALAGGTGFLPAYTGTASGIFAGTGTGAAAGSTAATATGAAAGSTAAAGGSGAAVGGSAGAAAGAEAGAGIAGGLAYLPALPFALAIGGMLNGIFGRPDGPPISSRDRANNYSRGAGSIEAALSSLQQAGVDTSQLKASSYGGSGLNTALGNVAEATGAYKDWMTPEIKQFYDQAVKSYDNNARSGFDMDHTYYMQDSPLLQAYMQAKYGAADPNKVATGLGGYSREQYDEAENYFHSSEMGLQSYANSLPIAFEASGNQAANGGLMPGKEQDPSGSKDNIPIMVSGGEYVVPKSVVDTLGAGFFDNLVNLYHTQIPGRPATK